MKLVVMVFISGYVWLCDSAPSFTTNDAKRCNQIMKANCLTARFPGAVAHGIHSITLEDIRHYFKPDASEQNGVPTLNYDLKDKHTVLTNAKLYGYDTSFKTIGMQHLDQVMINMDREDFYLTNYNTLEKLVHTIHMNEVWSKTKTQYDAIAAHKQHDEELCKCVTDLDRNGVMKMLPFMSLKIRYPGITSGKVLNLPNGMADWSNNLYQYAFFNNWSDELNHFNFTQDISEILHQATIRLVDGDKGMEHLDNEKAWATWKSGMKSMVAHDDYELAMFLYCTLNKS